MRGEEVRPLIGLLGAAMAAIIWAGWIVATRAAVVDHVNPLMLAFCRFIVPAILLFPVVWRRGIIPRDTAISAVAMMTLGWGLPYPLLTGVGLQTVPASLFAPLTPGLAPILIALLSVAFLGERLRGEIIAGLVLVGMSLVLVLGSWILEADHEALRGAAWLIAGSFAFAIYNVNFQRSGLSPIEATAYVAVWSMPLVLPLYLLQPKAFSGFTLGEWAFHLVVQGLLTGMIAGVAYALAIRHLGTVRGSMVNALMPVVSALAGISVLGESLGVAGWMAVCLASLGVAAANGAFRRWVPVRSG